MVTKIVKNATTGLTETSDYLKKVLGLSAKDEITQVDVAWITQETVDGFKEHVNPSFLEYRKTVTLDNQFVAVEWSDDDSCFKDINGKTYIDCLGGFGIFNVGHRHPNLIKSLNGLQKELQRRFLTLLVVA